MNTFPEYEFHEVANLFPLMSDEEFNDLVADIKENGLVEAIYLHDNKIVDGRNRYNACKKAGVTPRFCEWDGDGSLTKLVVSLNMKRRHLTASQKGVAAIKIDERFAVEAKERQKEAGKAHGRGKEIACGNLATSYQGKDQNSKDSDETKGKKSRDKAAEVLGVSPRYVSDAKRIQKTHPEKIKEIESGKKTIPQVLREIKEEEQQQQQANNKEEPVKHQKGRKKKTQYQLDREEERKVSSSFEEAFDKMLYEVKNAKHEKWEATTKAAALKKCNILINVIEIGGV